MRNDAHDELEHVPSLTTDPRDRDDYSSDPHGSVHQPVPQGSARHYPQVERRRGLGTGPLWALIGALVIAFGGLSWWSYQQIAQMQAQLVVTQETFARISEEASGRIQDISGKVVATESSVTTDNEALKLRIKSLDSKLAELGKAQQNIAGQQSGQGRRIDQLAAELKAQQHAPHQLPLAGRPCIPLSCQASHQIRCHSLLLQQPYKLPQLNLSLSCTASTCLYCVSWRPFRLLHRLPVRLLLLLLLWMLQILQLLP